MISGGFCDTEDWSNDAENSALPSQEYILKKECIWKKIYFQIYWIEKSC